MNSGVTVADTYKKIWNRVAKTFKEPEKLCTFRESRGRGWACKAEYKYKYPCSCPDHVWDYCCKKHLKKVSDWVIEKLVEPVKKVSSWRDVKFTT